MMPFHFFATNVHTWALTNDDRDLHALMKFMDKQGDLYSLWYVPLPHSAIYEITANQPVVKDAVYLGHYLKGKRS
jgi:hypothetical protein